MANTHTSEEPREHPAARAARMVKEYHQETLEKIAGGFVFRREGADVNAQLREFCELNIAECDAIIERASRMDPSMIEPSMAILAEAMAPADV